MCTYLFLGKVQEILFSIQSLLGGTGFASGMDLVLLLPKFRWWGMGSGFSGPEIPIDS